jgi:hypothetical protein
MDSTVIALEFVAILGKAYYLHYRVLASAVKPALFVGDRSSLIYRARGVTKIAKSLTESGL